MATKRFCDNCGAEICAANSVIEPYTLIGRLSKRDPQLRDVKYEVRVSIKAFRPPGTATIEEAEAAVAEQPWQATWVEQPFDYCGKCRMQIAFLAVGESAKKALTTGERKKQAS